MYKSMLSILAAAAPGAGFVFGSTPDLSEKWQFPPGKSTNVGMMAMMKINAKVRHTADLLLLTTVSVFNGAKHNLENCFDLTGKPLEDWTPMSYKAQTVNQWQDGRLVPTSLQPGTPAGGPDVRAQTRYSSADGKTMTAESVRKKVSTMIVVHERKGDAGC